LTGERPDGRLAERRYGSKPYKNALFDPFGRDGRGARRKRLLGLHIGEQGLGLEEAVTECMRIGVC
jgi:hypothetical protein